MTPEIKEQLSLHRLRRPVYTAVRRKTKSTHEFLPHVTPGPADLATTILEQTIDKPGISLRKATDPTSYFEVSGQKIRSVVKAVAASAVEFWTKDVGHIDLNEAVRSPESTESTLDRIQSLRESVSDSGLPTLLVVEAGLNLTKTESTAAERIHSSLQGLPTKHFRVAILGLAAIDPAAQA
jgi:hypothetical protein